MAITAHILEPAGDGFVRIGIADSMIGIALPQSCIGTAGADFLTWVSSTTIDKDEVETEHLAQPLKALVHHDFAGGGWRIRASLHNTSEQPVSVPRVAVQVQPGDGQAWVWAAGAAGLVVLSTHELGTWAFTLQRGSLTREDSGLYWLDDGTTLEPGRRVIFELIGRQCRNWNEIGAMLPSWLPPLAVRGGEPIDLVLPDAGLVAPGCTIVERPDGTELRGEGRQLVQVNGAFGEVNLELAFAPQLQDAVGETARQIAAQVSEVPEAVQGEDAPKGKSALQSAEAAARRLIILQSVRTDEVEGDVRGKLLEEVIQHARSGETVGPFTLAALAGEVQRRADPIILGLLVDVLQKVSPEPGIVVALMRVWAVLWGLGTDPDPVRHALDQLLSQPASTRLGKIEHGLGRGEQAAITELFMALGGGLPGTVMPVPQAWEVAYTVALASLVGETDPQAPSVVQAAEIVARRLTAQDPNDPDVLAWLLLGER